MLYNILSALRFMPNLITFGLKVIKGVDFICFKVYALPFDVESYEEFFKKGHFIHLRVCNLIFGERVFYE